jgi:prepilin-type N-terminal cleavage/methylation domain-containing protein
VTAGRGFSLVEVMVAAALVALATAGALTLTAQGRRAHRTAEARARLEDSARAALDLLTYEVRHAGYLGPLVPGSPVEGATRSGSPAPAGLAVSGGCVDSLALDLAQPIAGADGAYAATTDLPLSCRPSPGGRMVPGSDTLILRRASVEATGAAPGRLQLETTRRQGRLMSDGVARLGASASVHDLEVSVFYVSPDSTDSRGRPSLRRKRLVGGSSPAFQDEELVTGIADLQVEAELAADAEWGTLPRVLPLGEVPANARIRTLRLWVLAEGDMADGASDQRPPLAYANREWPARQSRFGRLVTSRQVEPRNAGARQ